MKVVAFNGSARKDGNTADMLRAVLSELEAAGMDTELVQLAGKKVHGCTACMKCREEFKDGQCHGVNDFVNECIDKMRDADGIIIGSPTYYADITSEAKALIDRAGYALGSTPEALRRKVGAAVVVARRGGAIHAFDSINHFFFINQMIVPGASYWNMAYGRNKGEAEEDAEGLRTMKVLGENMAWLMQRVADR